LRKKGKKGKKEKKKGFRFSPKRQHVPQDLACRHGFLQAKCQPLCFIFANNPNNPNYPAAGPRWAVF
jgi:hypothetical protein